MEFILSPNKTTEETLESHSLVHLVFTDFILKFQQNVFQKSYSH